MQSKRDGLVPVAEALFDLGGPVQALRDASPQARHHFTQADQVNQLVTASEAYPDLGFMARMMAHSGRVGLASELTARGASTTEVMLAGNWKTARMVAHYSAGATAERGAVAKYL